MIRLKTEHWPKAKHYQDYREMLDRQKDIDAVVVATADHMHAPIALAAMDLNKHVYVQKPLTWSVEESRRLARRAKELKIATQMGNQGHSLNDARTTVEYIRAGAIGEVREAHIWTNRPLGFWPQGVPRPEPLKQSADTLEVERPGHYRAHREFFRRQLSRSRHFGVGFISRRRPARRLSPHLSSVQLARLGRLGRRRNRRHGRAFD